MGLTSRAVCLVLLSLAVCHAVSAQTKTPVQQIGDEFIKLSNLAQTCKDLCQKFPFAVEGPRTTDVAGELTYMNEFAPNFHWLVGNISVANDVVKKVTQSGRMTLSKDDQKKVIQALTLFVSRASAFMQELFNRRETAVMTANHKDVFDTLTKFKDEVNIFKESFTGTSTDSSFSATPDEIKDATTLFLKLKDEIQKTLDRYTFAGVAR